MAVGGEQLFHLQILQHRNAANKLLGFKNARFGVIDWPNDTGNRIRVSVC